MEDLYFEVPGKANRRYRGGDCRRFFFKSLLPNDYSEKMNQTQFTDVYFQDTSGRILHVFINGEEGIKMTGSFLDYSFNQEELATGKLCRGEKLIYGAGQETGEITKIECVSVLTEHSSQNPIFLGVSEGVLMKEFHRWRAHQSNPSPALVL